MPHFNYEGITFNYQDLGSGLPCIFQHGLGGDVNQPFGLLTPLHGTRLLAFDFRGHGQTQPLGDANKFTIDAFADDLNAFLDFLGVQEASIGGISLGAAVALDFALRFPHRVRGLVLSRPAWLDRTAPANLAIYDLIAKLLREHGAERGLEAFLAMPQYAQISSESPDAAASLVGQFNSPRAVEALIRLEQLPHCAPLDHLNRCASFDKPVLVMANRQDPVHPYQYGETLAASFPNAIFRELTPKSINKIQHAADVQRNVDLFLQSLLEKSL